MKIAITSKSFSKNEFLINKIKEEYPEAEIKLQLEPIGLNQDELIEFLADCDKAIVGLEEINEEVLSSCPKLKRVSKFGVGLNNIDKSACEKHNVTIGWTGGVNKLSVAEMALGFMIGMARNLYQSSFYLNEGEWRKNGGYQLSEKTIGIIGVGHIGKEVIRLLKPFDCNILVNDIIDQAEYYESVKVTKTSKEEIYKKCDIITIHTPLTDETKDLFNKTTFALCEKNPYIINTARGGIINEGDVVGAIEANLISGAAIDAYISEPLDIEKIYSNKKIICTPHIGGNAKEAVIAMGLSSIRNLTHQ